MKFFSIFLLFLSGCSTLSYQAGCHDGIKAWLYYHEHAGIEESILDKACPLMEDMRKNNKDLYND